MRRRLAMETPPFHTARKAMTLTPTPGIDKLALTEPARREHTANRDEGVLFADTELDDTFLRRDAGGREDAEVLAREVARVAPAVADLHRAVAVARARLVPDDLAPVQLQHRAADALGRRRVEHRGHAFLHRQHACPVRHCVGLALEGRGP